MASHKVEANMKVLELNNNGSSINLKIFDGTTKLGEIELGRGTIAWRGSRRRKSTPIAWTKFAKMMNEYAYGEGN